MTCDFCDRAREIGWWGDSTITHCKGCHRTWSRTSRDAHCTVCHEHFGGAGAFDKHLASVESAENCRRPPFNGLEHDADGVWHRPTPGAFAKTAPQTLAG